MKNIYKTGSNTFKIIKYVNNKQEYFGCTNTYEEAVNLKKKCEENNWDKKILNQKGEVQDHKTNPMRHIHKNRDKYYVNKFKDGKLVYYGLFHNLEDAIRFRDYAEANNWEVEPVLKKYKTPHCLGKLPKYINYLKSKKYYTINHYDEESNSLMYYGHFKSLNEALNEREICIKCGWDWDAIVNY
ncbi:hypothetical protein [Methanobrevibacter sp. UBA313]|jgi:hypothetical protein|uniref:hypothetical protein n=1 Tax=Methanobrevibacter sp. UBA313 TaxID=1915477 RepID=UPI0039B87729